jgi:hypothetical protein
MSLSSKWNRTSGSQPLDVGSSPARDKEVYSMKYLVSVREVYTQSCLIEADNGEEAIDKVAEGEGKIIDDFEYVRTLDKDEWKVFEVK